MDPLLPFLFHRPSILGCPFSIIGLGSVCVTRWDLPAMPLTWAVIYSPPEIYVKEVWMSLSLTFPYTLVSKNKKPNAEPIWAWQDWSKCHCDSFPGALGVCPLPGSGPLNDPKWRVSFLCRWWSSTPHQSFCPMTAPGSMPCLPLWRTRSLSRANSSLLLPRLFSLEHCHSLPRAGPSSRPPAETLPFPILSFAQQFRIGLCVSILGRVIFWLSYLFHIHVNKI